MFFPLITLYELTSKSQCLLDAFFINLIKTCLGSLKDNCGILFLLAGIFFIDFISIQIKYIAIMPHKVQMVHTDDPRKPVRSYAVEDM